MLALVPVTEARVALPGGPTRVVVAATPVQDSGQSYDSTPFSAFGEPFHAAPVDALAAYRGELPGPPPPLVLDVYA